MIIKPPSMQVYYNTHGNSITVDDTFALFTVLEGNSSHYNLPTFINNSSKKCLLIGTSQSTTDAEYPDFKIIDVNSQWTPDSNEFIFNTEHDVLLIML